MSNQAVVATNLTKWFGEGEAKTTAVKGIGLILNFGEMLFIVGPSRSGKTTLLSMISGILQPNDGTVTVHGIDIWTLDANQLAELSRRSSLWSVKRGLDLENGSATIWPCAGGQTLACMSRKLAQFTQPAAVGRVTAVGQRIVSVCRKRSDRESAD